MSDQSKRSRLKAVRTLTLDGDAGVTAYAKGRLSAALYRG